MSSPGIPASISPTPALDGARSSSSRGRLSMALASSYAGNPGRSAPDSNLTTARLAGGS